MLTYEQFEKYIVTIQKYQEYENTLADMGINIWEREEIANLVTNYIELIEIGMNLPLESELSYDIPNDFDYWFYEVDCGINVDSLFNDEDPDKEYFGTDIKKHYDYLVRTYGDNRK